MAKNKTHKRVPPAPVQDPFSFDANSIELDPRGFIHVDDWMQVALRRACSSSGCLEDAAIFSLVWNLTHKDGKTKPGKDAKTRCTRSWLAAKAYRLEPDTITASVNFLCEAGLLRKEFVRVAKNERDPKTGMFIRTSCVTTDWELSTVDDSPDIQYALAWREGQEAAAQEAARAAKTPRQVLENFKASLGDFIDALDDSELSLLVDSNGNPNMKLFSALFAELGRRTTSDDAALKAPEGPSGAVSCSNPTEHCSGAERGPESDWEALKAATVNRNKLDEAEGEYWALRTEGYSADEVSRAWAKAQARVDDDRYKPQLLKWLRGEGSMSGENSARAMLDHARKHPVRIDPSAVLDDFDPASYAASLAIKNSDGSS